MTKSAGARELKTTLARLDELAAQGAIQRGSGTLADWKPLPLAGPGLAQAIAEEREGRV